MGNNGGGGALEGLMALMRQMGSNLPPRA